MTDTYRTLAQPAEGLYKEKGSKFISLAFPVRDEEEVKKTLAEVKKKYFDARHHCYAFMLGADKKFFRANDDGEPNHSAGDPILGQIRSANLSYVLVVVVRYFGGVKLGVGGLITAYKTAAAAALANARVVEQAERERLRLHYPYEAMNEVMNLVKTYELPVMDQQFDLSCRLEVEVRQALVSEVEKMFLQIEGVNTNGT
ncbi:YigZ family protein [soil metagenome]